MFEITKNQMPHVRLVGEEVTTLFEIVNVLMQTLLESDEDERYVAACWPTIITAHMTNTSVDLPTARYQRLLEIAGKYV